VAQPVASVGCIGTGSWSRSLPETLTESDQERPDADLKSPVKTLRVPGPQSPVTWGPLRYQPDQASSQGFLERLPRELLFLPGVERHYAIGMVDGPESRARRGARA
jgi:hypothetical protein